MRSVKTYYHLFIQDYPISVYVTDVNGAIDWCREKFGFEADWEMGVAQTATSHRYRNPEAIWDHYVFRTEGMIYFKIDEKMERDLIEFKLLFGGS